MSTSTDSEVRTAHHPLIPSQSLADVLDDSEQGTIVINNDDVDVERASITSLHTHECPAEKGARSRMHDDRSLSGHSVQRNASGTIAWTPLEKTGVGLGGILIVGLLSAVGLVVGGLAGVAIGFSVGMGINLSLYKGFKSHQSRRGNQSVQNTPETRQAVEDCLNKNRSVRATAKECRVDLRRNSEDRRFVSTTMATLAADCLAARSAFPECQASGEDELLQQAAQASIKALGSVRSWQDLDPVGARLAERMFRSLAIKAAIHLKQCLRDPNRSQHDVIKCAVELTRRVDDFTRQKAILESKSVEEITTTEFDINLNDCLDATELPQWSSEPYARISYVIRKTDLDKHLAGGRSAARAIIDAAESLAQLVDSGGEAAVPYCNLAACVRQAASRLVSSGVREDFQRPIAAEDQNAKRNAINVLLGPEAMAMYSAWQAGRFLMRQMSLANALN